MTFFVQSRLKQHHAATAKYIVVFSTQGDASSILFGVLGTFYITVLNLLLLGCKSVAMV